MMLLLAKKLGLLIFTIFKNLGIYIFIFPMLSVMTFIMAATIPIVVIGAIVSILYRSFSWIFVKIGKVFVIPILVNILERDSGHYQDIAKKLANVGTSMAPYLIRSLKNDNLRKISTEALVEIGPPAIIFLYLYVNKHEGFKGKLLNLIAEIEGFTGIKGPETAIGILGEIRKTAPDKIAQLIKNKEEEIPEIWTDELIHFDDRRDKPSPDSFALELEKDIEKLKKQLETVQDICPFLVEFLKNEKLNYKLRLKAWYALEANNWEPNESEKNIIESLIKRAQHENFQNTYHPTSGIGSDSLWMKLLLWILFFLITYVMLKTFLVD